jgi:outer membrane protein
MKNFSFILNIILLVAVAVLYYLHFSKSQSTGSGLAIPSQTISSSIVFVNSDSLLDNYEFFKDIKTRMESKEDSIDNLIKAQASRLESEIVAYQKDAPGMTDQQRMVKEEELMKKQQALGDRRKELLNILEEEEGTLNDSLYAKLQLFLKDFNKDKNFSFILSYQRGGGILHANDSLNITNEVVKGLNERYEKE